MKILLVISVLAFATIAWADNVHTAYGYLMKYGVPEAEKLRAAEEAYAKSQERIVGGVPAGLGQYPYQAGLIIDLVGFNEQAVCGAILISDQRLLTAAHCWADGQIQAWRYTVVLGSVTLFTAGTRIQTSSVITHPSWFPLLARNDIAAIYLPEAVAITATIAPVALPSGSELNEDFNGERAIASGFGWTSDGGSITTGQFLSHVSLQVISNTVCSFSFPLVIQPSHICTSGLGGGSTCRGDSGGPLVVVRNNRPVLIGITSFVHTLGCQSGMSAGYTRVTSFMDFINLHI